MSRYLKKNGERVISLLIAHWVRKAANAGSACEEYRIIMVFTSGYLGIGNRLYTFVGERGNP